jgi:Tol biopolymer transport system component
VTGTPARLAAALADRYVLERELGAGGMATVYLAHDVRHDRKVAVKVLRPELAAVLGAERFVVEIRTTAALSHPHILPLFDSGTADGFLYYVMPYIEGETLRTKLDREKQLGIDEAVKIATGVADALDYAHRHGVIHRDIKPENILLHDGRPMVADFGIALAVSAAAGGRMTETGLSLGTPHYMSPEQATAEKDISNRSDVYSLGCVLYEMLTGNPPHVGATAQQIIMKIVTEEAQPVTAVRKSVPPNVAAAVAQAIEKLPADRFSTAIDFARALANPAFAATTAAALSTGHVARIPHAARAPRRWLPWAIAAAMALLAIASWALRRGTQRAEPLLAALESPPGTEFAEFRFAALSPDGDRLAFIGLGATGTQQLWMRDLATGRTDSLADTRGAEAPFWSPDGRSLAFVARGRLMRLDLDARVSTALCPTRSAGGSWSRQGLILFVRDGHPMTVRAEGGACTPVPGAWSDSTRTIDRVAWFPDGRHFAGLDTGGIVRSDITGAAPQPFIEQAGDVQFVVPDIAVYSRTSPRGSDVVAQRFDPLGLTLSGRPVTLAQGVRQAGAIASFTVSPRALVYLAAPQGDLGPLIEDASGRVTDSVAVEGTWTMRISRDGASVALAGIGLWRWDVARHTATALTSHLLNFPVWGPGDSLLVVADYTCRVSLFRLASGRDTTLIDGRSRGDCYWPTDWTSDGAFVVLASVSTHGRPDDALWTLNLRTGAIEPLVSVAGIASSGAVSPDGRWLAYVSDETGDLEVYLRPFRGNGAPVRVSTAGGALPRWRRDGRALFYIAPDGRIMRADIAAGASAGAGAPVPMFTMPRWSVRMFADRQGGRQATTIYDVTPDGTRFLTRQHAAESPLARLLVDWQGLFASRGGSQAHE